LSASKITSRTFPVKGKVAYSPVRGSATLKDSLRSLRGLAVTEPGCYRPAGTGSAGTSTTLAVGVPLGTTLRISGR
jgi:hypothetical protein